MNLACEHIPAPKNNVCENEPTNDFHDVILFGPIAIWFRKSRTKLTSWKSFVGSFSQTLFFGGVTQKPEIRLCTMNYESQKFWLGYYVTSARPNVRRPNVSQCEMRHSNPPLQPRCNPRFFRGEVARPTAF